MRQYTWPDSFSFAVGWLSQSSFGLRIRCLVFLDELVAILMFMRLPAIAAELSAIERTTHPCNIEVLPRDRRQVCNLQYRLSSLEIS